MREERSTNIGSASDPREAASPYFPYASTFSAQSGSRVLHGKSLESSQAEEAKVSELKFDDEPKNMPHQGEFEESKIRFDSRDQRPVPLTFRLPQEKFKQSEVAPLPLIFGKRLLRDTAPT